MNKPLSLFFLTAMSLAPLASAETVATVPIGYTTYKLAVGLNAIGQDLLPAPIASGAFTLTTGFGNVLTDTTANFQVIAGRTYVVDILTGTLAGTVLDVPASAITATTVTVSSSTTLEQLGLANGDKYQIRVANTLEEIFGTKTLEEGGVLTAALNWANSDVIWVPTGNPGVFDKYFLKSNHTFQRITGTGYNNYVAASNVPLVYSDGFFVEKKASSVASVVFQGIVKSTGTNSVVSPGLNLISVVAPVGLTLRTSGLENYLTSALNVGNSDLVWIQDPNTLAYKKYFRHSGNGGTWRLASGTTGVALGGSEDPALRGAIYIERKYSGSLNLKLNVPSGYSLWTTL